MTDIQSFFCFIGIIVFCLLSLGLFWGIAWTILDHYESRSRRLEDKYFDIWHRFRDVEIIVNRLKSEAESNNERTK